MHDTKILVKPIAKLEVSDTFKQNCAAMGFQTLQEVTAIAPAELLGNERSNYIWFGELVEILKKNGLLHLLQASRGHSRI